MRYLVYILIVLCTFYLASCDPCDNLDCQFSNYFGQFRIISKVNNKDLVFGPDRIYDKNLIKFYSLKGADTTFYETKAIYLPGSGFDSILAVNFFPTASTAYIRLSNGDIDTLNLSYNSTTSKCCGTVTEINNFRLNTAAELGNNSTTREIKK